MRHVQRYGAVIRRLAVAAIICVLSAGPATSQAPTQDRATVIDFLSRILGVSEEGWHSLFASGAMSRWRQAPSRYTEPVLNFYSRNIITECGSKDSAMIGPFYCTADRELFLDVDFFALMDGGPFGADAAQAYVVLHEVGHHVQVLTGVEAEASAFEAQNPGSRRASLRLELQADCFAGVVFAYAQRELGIMEPGDREEVIAAARSLGENYPGGDAAGVVADAFTHGSADQRERWLLKGFDTGDPAQCDTFSATAP